MEVPPYWVGRRTFYPPDNIIQNYQLGPGRKDMLKSLIDFVKLKYSVLQIESKEQRAQTTHYLTVNITKIGLYLNSENQKLSVESENKKLLKEIGEKFNQELLKGRFQNDFGKFEVD